MKIPHEGAVLSHILLSFLVFLGFLFYFIQGILTNNKGF